MVNSPGVSLIWLWELAVPGRAAGAASSASLTGVDFGAAASAGVASGGLASGVRPAPQPIAGSQTRRIPARPKRRRRGIEDLLPEKTGTDRPNDKRQISIILTRAVRELKG
jgi:hypothetical protein